MAKFDLGGAVSTHNLLAATTTTANDHVYKSQPNLATTSSQSSCIAAEAHRSLHGLLAADRRPLVALVMDPASVGLLAMEGKDGPASSPIAGFKSSFAKECAQLRQGSRAGAAPTRDFSPPPSPYVRPTQTSVTASNRRFSSNLHKYRVKQQV